MSNFNGSMRRTGAASFRLAPASRVFMSGDEEGDGKPDEVWYHAREVDAAAQTDLPPIHARFDRNEATSTGFTCEDSV